MGAVGNRNRPLPVTIFFVFLLTSPLFIEATFGWPVAVYNPAPTYNIQPSGDYAAPPPLPPPPQPVYATRSSSSSSSSSSSEEYEHERLIYEREKGRRWRHKSHSDYDDYGIPPPGIPPPGYQGPCCMGGGGLRPGGLLNHLLGTVNALLGR